MIYLVFIWLQSSYFNPEIFYEYASYINMNVIIFLGVLLELAHLIEFGILYLILLHILLTYGGLTVKKEVAAAVFSIGYGLVDEIHQLYVPFRSFSLLDLLKNIVGVLVVMYIFKKYYNNRRLIKEKSKTNVKQST
ncbi:VanZ family protein [Cytobacillus purgationiresistens]|uniref:VanZ family protein n=1 Tax=Cytobacillus purgationiresistens TaxID=863449 RepID=A0ABU0AI65_9BACI|nr:VanZ family protein [Cytobacillus purgationiresistens]